MPITIITPKPAGAPRPSRAAAGSDSGSDSDGGARVGGRASKKARGAGGAAAAADIVTPGQVITDDPQWMRGHGTYAIPQTTPPAIASSVAGTVERTNRLLSVRSLRSRYAPEVGDLVVGRVVEVQARRWRVEVGSTQLASLLLSAVNLPGGVLRKRTATDELRIRAFFAEGDLVVAEVQAVHADGGAMLHTRSLRFGKLKNGVFLSVAGGLGGALDGAGRGGNAGGGGGGGKILRSRRQTWTTETAGGGGKVDVILGVNGYVWISKHVDTAAAAAAAAAAAQGSAAEENTLSRMEESAAAGIVYSSQNDFITGATMREMSRLRAVVVALVENGVRVDEETVMRAYRAAVDMSFEGLGGRGDADEEEGSGDNVYLGGEKGRLLAAMAVGR